MPSLVGTDTMVINTAAMVDTKDSTVDTASITVTTTAMVVPTWSALITSLPVNTALRLLVPVLLCTPAAKTTPMQAPAAWAAAATDGKSGSKNGKLGGKENKLG